MLQCGTAYLHSERCPEEETAKLDLAKKAATSVIIQYLGLLPSKRVAQIFSDIEGGGPLREMLYERYESRRDVRQHLRDVVINPNNSERIVQQLCEELRQLRAVQNKEELESLSLVH